MELYLIRHGRQSSRLCNVMWIFPRSRRQSALLGHRLADWGIEVLYSSSLIRAVQTAEEYKPFFTPASSGLSGAWRDFFWGNGGVSR